MYALVKDLPAPLQRALSSFGYRSKDIAIRPAETFSVGMGGGAGSRSFVCIVNLSTGEMKSEVGSWGGANPFETRLVDNDRESRPLPPNMAVIKGSMGNGTFAQISVNPQTLAPLLPAKPELSDTEREALSIVNRYKSSYRADAFRENGLGKYVLENPLVRGLVERGFLKTNAAGALSVTTNGKNAL